MVQRADSRSVKGSELWFETIKPHTKSIHREDRICILLKIHQNYSKLALILATVNSFTGPMFLCQSFLNLHRHLT